MDEEPPTPLMPLPSTETLPGMDSPVIPRTIDLDAISQQELDSYLAVAGDYFVDYFLEGISPMTNVLRANERVGPGGEFKVLVACNVTPDVWERRFADIHYHEYQARPTRLEMDNDCVYIFNVPGRTHKSVQFEVCCTLAHAMKASGIPMEQADVEWKSSGQYFDETVIMEHDIAIIANNRTIAVLEIEITHRSVQALRAHVQRIFNGDVNVIIVGVLKVHGRRGDGSFAAEFVAWMRGDDGTIQCLPACVHDFGTAASNATVINHWRAVRDDAPDAVVPQNVQFIQQEHRAAEEQRGPLVLPVADVLRVALNDVHDVSNAVPISIDLTGIVSFVHMHLPLLPEN